MAKTAREAWRLLTEDLKGFSVKAFVWMEKAGWTWMAAGAEGQAAVPSPQQIHEHTYYLAWDTVLEVEKAEAEHACIVAGGIQVRIAKYGDEWTAIAELVPVDVRTW